MPEPRYTLAVTATQLRDIARAADLDTRVAMGQEEDLLDVLPLREPTGPGDDRWLEDREVARGLLRTLRRLYLQPGCYHGIRECDEQTRRLGDLYAVIQHQLTTERGDDGRYNVWAFPVHQVAPECPLATVTRQEEGESDG